MMNFEKGACKINHADIQISHSFLVGLKFYTVKWTLSGTQETMKVRASLTARIRLKVSRVAKNKHRYIDI